MEQLPFRPDARLARELGIHERSLHVVPAEGTSLPRLRGELERPAAANRSFVLRVHTAAGLPLAHSSITLTVGQRAFETQGMTLLAMEGYAHLKEAERQSVENRVWSRRAYATASAS